MYWYCTGNQGYVLVWMIYERSTLHLQTGRNRDRTIPSRNGRAEMGDAACSRLGTAPSCRCDGNHEHWCGRSIAACRLCVLHQSSEHHRNTDRTPWVCKEKCCCTSGLTFTLEQGESSRSLATAASFQPCVSAPSLQRSARPSLQSYRAIAMEIKHRHCILGPNTPRMGWEGESSKFPCVDNGDG